MGALGEPIARWSDGSLEVSPERLVGHRTELFVSHGLDELGRAGS